MERTLIHRVTCRIEGRVPTKRTRVADGDTSRSERRGAGAGGESLVRQLPALAGVIVGPVTTFRLTSARGSACWRRYGTGTSPVFARDTGNVVPWSVATTSMQWTAKATGRKRRGRAREASGLRRPPEFWRRTPSWLASGGWSGTSSPTVSASALVNGPDGPVAGSVIYGVWLDWGLLDVGQTSEAERRLRDLVVGESHHLGNTFPPKSGDAIVRGGVAGAGRSRRTGRRVGVGDRRPRS